MYRYENDEYWILTRNVSLVIAVMT